MEDQDHFSLDLRVALFNTRQALKRAEKWLQIERARLARAEERAIQAEAKLTVIKAVLSDNPAAFLGSQFKRSAGST